MATALPPKHALYAAGLIVSALSLLASLCHGFPIGPLEMLGAVSGAWGVWLTVEGNVWNWPIGMASSLVFAALFGHQRLFGAAGMQLAYVAFGAAGWYWWLRGGDRRERLCISRLPAPTVPLLVGLGLALLPPLVPFLRYLHDASPLPDALALALSLAAQYLVTRKFVEHWVVSIAADAIYITLYFTHGLLLTGGLYLMHLGSCACGWYHWRRSLASASKAAPTAEAALV